MTFYEKVSILDDLATLQDIGQGSVEAVSSLISEESLYKYWFIHLANPRWFDPLKGLGYFSGPPPLKLENDKFWLQGWPVLDYFEKISTEIPVDVTEAILPLSSDNARVLWGFVKIGNRLPAEFTGRLIAKVPDWIDCRYLSSTNFYRDIGGWIKHFVDANEFDSALKLTKILVAPISQEVQSYRVDASGNQLMEPKAQSIMQPSEFQHILEMDILPLTEASPFEIVEILKSALVAGIGIEHYGDTTNDRSMMWRYAIEDSRDNWDSGEFKETVTVAVRDALQAAVDQDFDRTRSIVESYANSETSILRRLAIHIVRVNNQKFLELATRLLLDKKNYIDYWIGHEFSLLFNSVFNMLSEPERDNIAVQIGQGPDAETELTEIERAKWLVKWLYPVRDGLGKEGSAILVAASATLAEPSIVDEAQGRSEKWDSELIARKMRESTAHQVIADLIKDIFAEHVESPSTTMQAFLDDVKLRPNEYLRLTEHELSRLDPRYTVNLFEVLRDYWNSGKIVDPSDFLQFLLELSSITDLDEKVIKGRDVNIGDAKKDIGTFLNENMRPPGKGGITLDLLGTVWQIIDNLCHDIQPTSKDEEEMLRGGADSYDISSNTVRGIGFQAALNYAVWIALHGAPGNDPRNVRREIEGRVKDLMDEKLSKTDDTSRGVHAVFGFFLPKLTFLDQDWVVNNLELIFHRDEIYWEAAWSAYVLYAQVYLEGYPLFRDAYRRAISDMTSGKSLGRGSGRSAEDHLGEHLMIAYLNEKEALSTSDSLINYFFNAASDHIRASAVKFLEQSARRERLFAGTGSKWKLAKELWRNRIETIRETGESTGHQEEFAAFLGWADVFPETVEDLRDLIKDSIALWKPGFFIGDLMRYLADQSKDLPRQSVSLLDQLIRQMSPEEMWPYLDIASAEKILKFVKESGDTEAKTIGNDLINLLGENGFYTFRPLLSIIE